MWPPQGAETVLGPCMHPAGAPWAVCEARNHARLAAAAPRAVELEATRVSSYVRERRGRQAPRESRPMQVNTPTGLRFHRKSFLHGRGGPAGEDPRRRPAAERAAHGLRMAELAPAPESHWQQQRPSGHEALGPAAGWNEMPAGSSGLELAVGELNRQVAEALDRRRQLEARLAEMHREVSQPTAAPTGCAAGLCCAVRGADGPACRGQEPAMQDQCVPAWAVPSAAPWAALAHDQHTLAQQALFASRPPPLGATHTATPAWPAPPARASQLQQSAPSPLCCPTAGSSSPAAESLGSSRSAESMAELARLRSITRNPALVLAHGPSGGDQLFGGGVPGWLMQTR